MLGEASAQGGQLQSKTKQEAQRQARVQIATGSVPDQKLMETAECTLARVARENYDGAAKAKSLLELTWPATTITQKFGRFGSE